MLLGVTACSSSGGQSSSTTDSGTSSATNDSSSSDESGKLTWKSASEYDADAVAGKTDDRAFKKFDDVVEVHFGQQVDPTDTTLPEGDTVDNNQYSRYLLDNYNIKVVADWTAGSAVDFNQKVALQIASGDLPDGLVVTSRTYMVKAAKAGLTANLYDSFEATASKQVKEICETTNGRAYENGTYNGEFVGLPNITVDADGVHVYFIRQDWLDQCGLEAPKTLSDLETAAKAFMDKGLSPNYAIAGKGNSGRTYCNFLESSNNSYGFDPIYQALGATPGYFLKDDSGKVYYGTLTDQMRSSLELLAKWYKEGLINPELGVSTNGSEADGVKSGTCGIFMGPWWNLGYGNGDSFKNDQTANWQAYPLYTDDGKWNVHMKDCGSSYTICSKNASADTLKAIMVMNNVLVRDESILDTSVAISWWPLRNVMAAGDEIEYEYKAAYDVLNGTKTAEDYNVPGSQYKLVYTDMLSMPDVIKSTYDPSKRLNVTDMDVLKNNGQFNRFYAMLIGDRPYATITPDQKIYSVLYSNIDVMDQYWSQLQDLEDQTVMSIITGKSDISAFDQFVTDWKAQGGDKVLAGVEEFINS